MAKSPTKRHLAFEAGQASRRLRMLPRSEAAINVQIRRYGKTVITRARYLCANNPYAAGAKEAWTSSLVGDGIKPSLLLRDKPDLRDSIHMAFNDWIFDADYDGVTDFYGLQQLVSAELFEAGEVFVRLMPTAGLTGIRLQLQILPSEQLPYELNELVPDTKNSIEMGIEFDSAGKRVAYHFHPHHPDDLNNSLTSTTEKIVVPADEVLHIYRRRRAGQIRGFPEGLSALRTLAITDAYEDAELERKRTAALFAVFITRPAIDQDEHAFESSKTPASDDIPVATDPKDESGQGQPPPDSWALEPGLLADLEEGEQVQTASPADVGGNYESFMYRQLTAIAAGFGVPYSSMTGDLRSTSFGSMRGGLIDFRRRIKSYQDRLMVFQFGRPVWMKWLTEAMLAQAIPVSGADIQGQIIELNRVKWLAPRFEWIDPLKDLQSEALAVNSGFKSRSDVIEETGGDPFETDKRIAEDQERADELGLKFGEAAKEPQGGGDGTENDENGEDDEDEDLDDENEGTKTDAA